MPVVTTKELFALFPKGPAKKVARIRAWVKPEGLRVKIYKFLVRHDMNIRREIFIPEVIVPLLYQNNN